MCPPCEPLSVFGVCILSSSKFGACNPSHAQRRCPKPGILHLKPHTPHPTPHTQLKYMRHVLSESYPEKMTRMVLATLINLTTDKGGQDVANQVAAGVLLACC